MFYYLEASVYLHVEVTQVGGGRPSPPGMTLHYITTVGIPLQYSHVPRNSLTLSCRLLALPTADREEEFDSLHRQVKINTSIFLDQLRTQDSANTQQDSSTLKRSSLPMRWPTIRSKGGEDHHLSPL
ncbi:hypothetical protein QWA68_002815 [Fusarium oxysporum]|nr:hypothetical protein QWA68_002815 [Fusarium oxysporum]